MSPSHYLTYYFDYADVLHRSSLKGEQFRAAGPVRSEQPGRLRLTVDETMGGDVRTVKNHRVVSMRTTPALCSAEFCMKRQTSRKNYT